MEQIEIYTIPNGETNATVMVRNAHKSYVPTSPILNDLNLTVPKGVIYGLLGPSGCGKTTLLNCIAGRMTLNSGSIKLNIRKRVEMGYMPQGLSLHSSMTILENFFFYGYLYGMDTEVIESRASELISFLDLPSKNRLVRDLSGGQQRRVSLAITIFHDPKLIILDEPTVGLDPILSESIWDHLLKMSGDGKTIIITTHYIQEARRAHVIGLLRNGKLLAEENPQSLIRKYNCDDLEEAFLKLCENQEIEPIKSESLQTKSQPPNKIIFEEDNRLFSKKKFIGITYKYQTLMKREYTFLVLLLTLPFLESAFFCMNAGRKPKNLDLAVINEEIPIADCEHMTYNECFLNENQTVPLSCLYLNLLRNQTYNFIEYSNETKALEDMRKNKVRGLVHFHENYTRSLAGRFLYTRDDTEVDFDSFSNGNVDTWIDLSDQVVGNILKYDVVRQLDSFMQKAFMNCEMSFRSAWTPIAFEEPIFGSFDEEFISYTSTALLTILCFFLPALSTANRIFQERKEGILERMLTAGVSITEIMLSTMLIEMIVYILQYLIIIVVLFYMFETPHEGNLMVISGLMLLTALSGMFYGMAIAVTHSTEMLLGYSGMGTNLLITMVTGIISSTEAAHRLVKSINWMFPLTLTIDATRGIAVRSLSLTHPVVLKGFAGTITWALLFLIIILIALKYKKNTLIAQK